MAQTHPKPSKLDPVWDRILREAEEAIVAEPLLGGVIHGCVLHHKSLEAALAYRMSQKLASSEMSEQILREIADEAYRSDPSLGAAARADIVAVTDRDPACHRFIQPLLFQRVSSGAGLSFGSLAVAAGTARFCIFHPNAHF